MSGVFDRMCAEQGRPSIPPERLLKAKVLIALFSVRSENLFVEQLHYNLLYRWFLDLDLSDPVFDNSTFSKNQQRLMAHDAAKIFFAQVVDLAREAGWVSDEHFSVDGTLIEARASMKSFVPKAQTPVVTDDDSGNPSVDFRGEPRSNATHQSTTDPAARWKKKSAGQEAKLCYARHALMENRSGLYVDLRVSSAAGVTEGDAALAMLKEQPQARTAGYALSQKVRKRIEEGFGWMKTVGAFRKTRFKGSGRTQLSAYLVGAACNLVRMAKLGWSPPKMSAPC